MMIDRPGFLFGKGKGEMQYPSPVSHFYEICIKSCKFEWKTVQ